MAFPTTGLLDDFNRADEGPPPSASWSISYGGPHGELKVSSNQCVVSDLTAGYFETNKGEGLTVTTGAGASIVGVTIRYMEI